jgi:hypothetical protein
VLSSERVGACGHAGRRFFAGFSPVDLYLLPLHVLRTLIFEFGSNTLFFKNKLWYQLLWKFRTQTDIRFMWFGNLPTPRSYWLVLINQGNNTDKEEEKTLLNSTLHTQALSTALSRYPSLCSLYVLHTHTRSSSLSIYVYKWEWRGINHAMIYATVYVLHHVQSGRLGIPNCIWWDIVCLHVLTPHTYMNILDSP